MASPSDAAAVPGSQGRDSSLMIILGFGSAVALSGDGSIALIGAAYATIGANQKQGAAYFFTKTSSGPQISIYLPLIVR